eukprot:COSAG01_NODE_4348_length_5116_cov_1.582220_7_plen_57_part_00
MGQQQVKQAILLGLVAQEHIYIEGPPGVAKTFIAELAAEATNRSTYVRGGSMSLSV